MGPTEEGWSGWVVSGVTYLRLHLPALDEVGEGQPLGGEGCLGQRRVRVAQQEEVLVQRLKGR